MGLCVERGADMLAAVLGILKAGAAYVPLDPAFPEDRLRFMGEDAQVSMLVSSMALAGSFGLPRERQLLLDADAAELAAHSDRRLATDDALELVPRIRRTLSIRRALPENPRALSSHTGRSSTFSPAWPESRV